MTVSSATAHTMTELTHLGYGVTNIYGDGAVRMSNGTVGVFVNPDGNVTPPHTRETQIAQAELVGAGITIKFGKV